MQRGKRATQDADEKAVAAKAAQDAEEKARAEKQRAEKATAEAQEGDEKMAVVARAAVRR